MNWQALHVSACGTHHVDQHNKPVYRQRFDAVLKFHTPGLAPVESTGQAWHIRPDGSAAYAMRFIRTFGYYEGLAAVTADDGWHHITVAGEDAYLARHTWCGNYQQGRSTVRDNNSHYYHINKDGMACYPERWRYAGDFRDESAVVQAENGLSTHIDRRGKPLHDTWFVDLDVFHKGFARARDEAGWMHIDVNGHTAYTRRFLSVEPFYNGQARVERFDGALEVINERGETLVTLRPPRQSEFAALSADMVGFWRTRSIATAVELGVIEALPATSAEVANRCGLYQDRTQRLLRALGELGLAVLQHDQWALTARGEYLQADHPLTLADAALEYANPMTTQWRQLPEALQKQSQWQPPDIFGEVGNDETRYTGHHRMLQSYARHDYRDVCHALGLRGDERLIDAGGGLGVLAQLIQDTYPETQVTVLERPEVVALAESSIRGPHWLSGSLFTPWGIEADGVVLSRVLHDWDDESARRVLIQARASLPIGGRVYIIEMLLTEDQYAGALSDLHLLVVTGGRERSEKDFRSLLQETGFQLTEVCHLATLPSIIIGVAK